MSLTQAPVPDPLADEPARIVPFGDATTGARSWDRLVGHTSWFILFAIVSTLIALGSNRTVTRAYWEAAENWLAGRSIYNGRGDGFLYLPQSAVLFIPFAVLPRVLGDILWRFVTIGTFAWGLDRLASRAEQRSRVPLFAVSTFIALPLSFTCARNGQATLFIAGLMMAAVALASSRFWWRCAACLVLATAVKPITVPLVLLSAALYRPLISRLAIGFVLMLILPSLTQSPDYVSSQYLGCKVMFAAAADESNLSCFAQVFWMLRIAGCAVTPGAQTLLRVIFAGLLLGVCLRGQRRVEGALWAPCFYALATAYLMLFSPRTENSTYAILGPAIGLSFAQALLVERRFWQAAYLGVIALGTVGSYEIGRLFTSPAHSQWLAPLMTIFFAIFVMKRLIADVASSGQGSDVFPLPQQVAPSRDDRRLKAA